MYEDPRLAMYGRHLNPMPSTVRLTNRLAEPIVGQSAVLSNVQPSISLPAPIPVSSRSAFSGRHQPPISLPAPVSQIPAGPPPPYDPVSAEV